MIAIISTSKTLDYSPFSAHTHSIPIFITEANYLASLLKKLKSSDMMPLMSISEKLAQQNYLRFKNFQTAPTVDHGKVAIQMFKGEVYQGIQADQMDTADLDFAQQHLRILSGLYGILKPLDLIQEYRLEIATNLTNKKGKNIYEFWGDKITKDLNQDILHSPTKILINLASSEYFKAIQKTKIKAQIIDIHFLEEKLGVRSFVSFNAKKARGLMASYLIKNKLQAAEQLKSFTDEGYVFDSLVSNDHSYTFVKYNT